MGLGALTDEFQPAEIIFRPTCLDLDDAPQSLHVEGVAFPMKRKRNPATVSVAIALVGPSLPDERKAIPGLEPR